MGLLDMMGGGPSGAPPVQPGAPTFADISTQPQPQSALAQLLPNSTPAMPTVTGHPNGVQSFLSSMFGPSAGLHLSNLFHGLSSLGQNPGAQGQPGMAPPTMNLGMPGSNSWQQHLAQLHQALTPQQTGGWNGSMIPYSGFGGGMH